MSNTKRLPPSRKNDWARGAKLYTQLGNEFVFIEHMIAGGIKALNPSGKLAIIQLCDVVYYDDGMTDEQRNRIKELNT